MLLTLGVKVLKREPFTFFELSCLAGAMSLKKFKKRYRLLCLTTDCDKRLNFEPFL